MGLSKLDALLLIATVGLARLGARFHGSFWLPASWVLYRLLRRHMRKSSLLNGRAVVVTGSDTGFGQKIALELATKGTVVFAGVLSEDSGQKLIEIWRKIDSPTCSGRIRPCILDVTKDDDISAAVEMVKQSGLELQGIVCNAGISAFGFAEMLPLDRFKANIDVNFFGVVRCCRAFMPLLRTSKGRIINMGSIGGHAPSAFGSSYLSTKAAMMSFSQCLRQEVHRFGVRVALVEPGFFRTELLKRGSSNGSAGANARIRSSTVADDLKNAYPDFDEKMALTSDAVVAAETLNEIICGGVSAVVDAVIDGLSNRHPLARYVVGVDATIIRYVVVYLPAWVVDWAQTLQG